MLLQGVNDTVESLVTLSHALWDSDVLPYYLHRLDPVEGAHHFLVSVNRGKQILAQMQAQLPGYLVPRYVWEEPFAASKQLIV